MADFTLTDGKATTVREDAVASEAHVDLDINGLTAQSTLQSTDQVVMQRGSNDPQKVSLADLQGGAFALNMSYLF